MLQSELSGGQELAAIKNRDSLLGSLLERIIDGTNTLAKNTGSAVVGKVPPPPKIDSITVQGVQAGGTITCPSEHLHWTLSHNQAINKGINYITEIATDPSFNQPHIVDHGCSRSGFLHLPKFQNNGSTVQDYYMRSYSQMPGSDASEPTVLGGLGSAVKINMTGTSASTLLPSTGSGTASPTGQQGGLGLGTVLTRPSPRPKRFSTK